MGSKCGLPSVAALRQLREQMAGITSFVISLENQAPEAVHETRIASRRVRILLREFSDSWEEGSRKRFSELTREVTRALGAPRELDVSIRLLRAQDASPYGDVVPSLLRVWQEQRADYDKAVRAVAQDLRSADFADAHETLLARFVRSGRCFRKLACERVGRRRKAAAKAYRKWRKAPSDDLLHALRITLKKLRYACEAHREVFEPDGMDRALAELREIQKKLGEWHDWHVTARRARNTTEVATDDACKGQIETLASCFDGKAAKALDAFRQQAKALFEGKGADFPALKRHDCKQIHRCKRPRPATTPDAQHPE